MPRQCVHSRAVRSRVSQQFDITGQSVLEYVQEVYGLEMDKVCLSRVMTELGEGVVIDLGAVLTGKVRIEKVDVIEGGACECDC